MARKATVEAVKCILIMDEAGSDCERASGLASDETSCVRVRINIRGGCNSFLIEWLGIHTFEGLYAGEMIWRG